MIKLKSNNGVTLAVLIITILVMVIILAITIEVSTDTVDSTIDSQDASEMLMIQHAIQERYIEYSETNDESILVGKCIGGYNYTISSKQTLSEIFPAGVYYIAITGTSPNEERTLYYIDTNNTPKEISTYKNAITNTDIDSFTEIETNYILDGYTTCKKITHKDKIIIDSLFALGITGQGVSSSEFEVNYIEGKVKKIGSSTTELKGYRKDEYENTTSTEIDIYN